MLSLPINEQNPAGIYHAVKKLENRYGLHSKQLPLSRVVSKRTIYKWFKEFSFYERSVSLDYERSEKLNEMLTKLNLDVIHFKTGEIQAWQENTKNTRQFHSDYSNKIINLNKKITNLEKEVNELKEDNTDEVIIKSIKEKQKEIIELKKEKEKNLSRRKELSVEYKIQQKTNDDNLLVTAECGTRVIDYKNIKDRLEPHHNPQLINEENKNENIKMIDYYMDNYADQ